MKVEGNPMKKKAQEASLYNRKRRNAIGGYSRAKYKRIYVNDPDAVEQKHNGFVKSFDRYQEEPQEEQLEELEVELPQPLSPEQVEAIAKAGLSASNYLALRDVLGGDFDPATVNEIELDRDQRNRLYYNLRRRSCGKKKKYQTRDIAKKKSKIMSQRYPCEKFAAYRCKFCPEYHVGHKFESREILFMGLEPIFGNSVR